MGSRIQLRPREAFTVYKAGPSLRMQRDRRRLDVRAGVLTATGQRFRATDMVVKGPMGEGSYGQVFEGLLSTSGGKEHVVLKRVKSRVEGAEEMGQMELLLNVYAAKNARGSIADFMGHCVVQPEEASNRLTPGLWLVWRYEGSKTLAYYLKRRDSMRALSQDLGVPEEAVPATVIKHIFECLTALHNAGVVHRDVKPLNLVLSEKDRRFKLIDLGAAADLRNGTNYTPDESILDPSYCPPEQYCLPTSAPHLAAQLAPLKMAISPLLWSRHKPDCFDSYSTGLVLMQLAVPKLRSSSALRTFNKSLQNCGCDLSEWRARERLQPSQTAALDADNGAGWDLAQALLRPRKVEVRQDGGVNFINEGKGARLRVFAALKHRFLKQDIRWSGASAEGAVRAQASGSMTDAAMAIWKRATSRLFDLESRIVMQAEVLDQQTTKVKKLQEDLQSKDAKTRAQLEAQLAKESSALSSMQSQLNTLTREFTSTAASAQRTLRGLFGGRKGPSVPDLEGVPTAQLRPGYGSAALAEPAKGSGQEKVARRSVSLKTAAEPQAAAVEEAATSSAGAKAGKALASAAVSGLYTGLKFTGLAVRVASGLAASIGKDAEKALTKADAAERRPLAEQSAGPAAPARPTRRASLAFMEMLRLAKNPSITVDSAWADVAVQFEGDRHFKNVADPQQQQQMFDTFKDALVQLEEAKRLKERAAASENFKVLLRELGMSGEAEWRQIRRQLDDLEGGAPAALSQEDQQRLFLEVRGELRAEQGFKALLQQTADISASTSWPLLKRKIWSDPRFEAVPEGRRVQLFRDFKAVLKEVEAYHRTQAVKEAARLEEAQKAAALAKKQGLNDLQDEQTRLKAEYDRMESKLKEMEARLKMKEASLFEADGVAAVVARDRQGNFVFRFDEDRDMKHAVNGNGKVSN